MVALEPRSPRTWALPPYRTMSTAPTAANTTAAARFVSSGRSARPAQVPRKTTIATTDQRARVAPAKTTSGA
jgi:hypothetical protein